VVVGELGVAQRDDQQRRQPADPAGEHGEQIERRLVGPVRVLDDERRSGRAGHLVEQRVDRRRVVAAGQVLGQRTAYLAGEVAHRSERTRRGQLVAPAPQHPQPRGVAASERLDQRRLAYSGFAGDQDQRAVAGDGGTRESAQPRELLIALQELHAHGWYASA
jgi:hypothetical protein